MGTETIILNAVLLVMICLAAYFGMRFFKSREEIEAISERFYQKIVRGDLARESDLNKLRETVGDVQKKTLYERTNEMLYYSGLRYRFRWLTPTSFIGAMVVITALGMGLGTFWLKSFVFVILLGIIFPTTVYLIMNILESSNYTKVEEELVLFMNMVENFSAANDDIISILDRTTLYLGKYLRSAVMDCVGYARMSGNTSGAMILLENHVEHPQFKRFISSLELSSRGSCEYRQVVEDYRERTQNSLMASKRLAAIYKNCRAEVFAILGVGIFVIYMSLGLVADMGGFWRVINANIIGQFLFVAAVIIYVFSTWYVCFKMKQD